MAIMSIATRKNRPAAGQNTTQMRLPDTKSSRGTAGSVGQRAQ